MASALAYHVSQPPMRRCSVSILILLLSLSAGCVQRLVPPLEQRTVVTIDRRGGFCVQGVCTSRTLIQADGTVFRDGVRLTTVSEAEVTRLVQLIAATDFAAMRAVRPPGPPPFAGCESAVDGFELIDALIASAPASPES